jgi:hypothetical protein
MGTEEDDAEGVASGPVDAGARVEKSGTRASTAMSAHAKRENGNDGGDGGGEGDGRGDGDGRGEGDGVERLGIGIEFVPGEPLP